MYNHNRLYSRNILSTALPVSKVGETSSNEWTYPCPDRSCPRVFERNLRYHHTFLERMHDHFLRDLGWRSFCLYTTDSKALSLGRHQKHHTSASLCRAILEASLREVQLNY